MKNVLAKTMFALPLLLGLAIAGGANSAKASDTSSQKPVVVTVDRAKIFHLSDPASTIIVGNPAIVDATVEDEKTLILTGRSYGVTNLIVLDQDGNVIVDKAVVVNGHETNTVRIYRRAKRETMACAPVCEPTLTIGDDSTNFAFASGQIQTKNSLALANAK